MSKNDEKNVQYYNMSQNDADSVMGDFFAQEEEQKRQELLDQGFQEVGIYDPNDESSWEAIRDKLLDLTD